MDLTTYTRRQFVQSGLALVSTVSTVPTFLNASAVAMTDNESVTISKPGVPEDRILVVVQLSGGNDGLNTVVPYGDRDYYDARPALAIAPDQVLRLDRDRGLGLHGQLGALKEMLDSGLASVVQGVGYPNPNRSHFASMDIWHTCQARGGRGLGWLGQALDEVASEQSSAMIAIGRQAPLAGMGRKIQPVSFENADLFRWSGAQLHEKLGVEYDRFNRAGMLPGADQRRQASFVMRTALDAQLASDTIRAAVTKSPATTFPRGRLSEQLRMVALMIRAELPTRVYYVGLGGFDTHAGQAGRHGNLLREFAMAMRGFYRELKAIGQDGRVLSVAFSEFGRRVAQNASGGTDHGTAGPMFLFGPMIRPGILGKHPSLSRICEGDLIHQIDFRSVYAAVLDRWLKADSRRVLGKTFKHAEVLDSRKVS